MEAIGSPVLDPDIGDQRWLMGYVSGWMYVGVGVVGLLGLAMPALRYHPGWQLGLGCASVIYGLLNVRNVLHWERRPLTVHIAAMWAALPVVGVALWATGGAHSYLRPVLLLAPVHWGFFLLRRRALSALCAGLILMYWTPLLYEHVQDGTIGTLATLSLTIAVVAAALNLVRHRLEATERTLRDLAQLDPLTGLLNRRGFHRALHHLVSAVRADVATYLVLLDLDDLKRINDSEPGALRQGATSHRFWDLALRNVGPASCHLRGYPGIGLLDGSARLLNVPVDRRAAAVTTVVLRPWDRAFFTFSFVVSAPCAHGVFPFGLRVIPPNGTQWLRMYRRFDVCGGSHPTVTPARAKL